MRTPENLFQFLTIFVFCILNSFSKKTFFLRRMMKCVSLFWSWFFTLGICLSFTKTVVGKSNKNFTQNYDTLWATICVLCALPFILILYDVIYIFSSFSLLFAHLFVAPNSIICQCVHMNVPSFSGSVIISVEQNKKQNENKTKNG